MKHALSVMVVGLCMTMMGGCAASVDDPIPPAPAPEEQRDPPERQLSTQLRDPQAILMAGIEIDRGLERVPPKEMPLPPSPQPEED